MKTNNSFIKRLKLTRTGKVLARKKGQNHFNAKESGEKSQKKKRLSSFAITAKSAARFLPGFKINK
ncbi:MAG TPA: 50S ribosomal protein L35 [Candidatus Vogelbacteria bacterium]|nr:50S ribosomal protein L35 [Candidatus Vogelbacteria bacterium]